jgi:RNA polymerase sigma-70 factor, ECF subfamily
MTDFLFCCHDIYEMQASPTVGRGKIRLQNTAAIPLSAEKNREFEKFYTEHYGMAHGYLVRVIRDTDDAYDVLIHSFELALARFDEYLSSRNPRYWFFGIIRNSASYFLRKRAKEFSEILPVPRATPTPEELLLQNEEESLLNRVLEALPEKYREVALLRFQDFSYKEISDVLGLSVEAVESRMRRAVVKLEPLYAEFKEKKR